MYWSVPQFLAQSSRNAWNLLSDESTGSIFYSDEGTLGGLWMGLVIAKAMLCLEAQNLQPHDPPLL